MSDLDLPLKRDDYLNAPDVRAFLDWATPLVDGTRRLGQSGPQGDGEFKTLFDAYRGYFWAEKSYEETVEFLGGLSRRIRESVKRRDHEGFHRAALETLKWGGVVGRNAKRLNALADEAIPLLEVNARVLKPATADLSRVWVVHPMNSGFSKIYSLMLDGFPIYDSRVACALASLVRLFCVETSRLDHVQELLAFGIPPNQGTAKRDPSCGTLTFPKTQKSGAGLYAKSNVMAAWILDDLSRRGRFGDLGDERQFALQSAMFMVGYEPLAAVASSPESSA